MSLRIGVDLDGTLADLSKTYHEYEDAIFGKDGSKVDDESQPQADTAGEDDGSDDEEPSDKERLKAAREASKRRDVIWRALRQTKDLWRTLEPIEPGAVRALYEATITHQWEVFFITQRPSSAGECVQLQSQRWLMEQGFESPSVLTLSGSRGKAAHALELDFLIDDTPKNCVDVVSDSKCRPILVCRECDPNAHQTAARMKIGVVHSFIEAIALLAQPKPENRESAITRILKKLGIGSAK